jgi:hypothetical protein
MTKALIVAKKNAPALYQRMQVAIAECHSVDDCKNIATQAGAIAAYYSQIKDDESVRKFLQVKLRAWRRIGEIVVSSGVDRSKCETTAEYIRKIRATFKGHKDIEQLTDSDYRQAIRVVEIPREFFERNAGLYGSIDSLASAFMAVQRRQWEASPEGRAELKRRNAQMEANRKADEAARKADEIKRKADEAKNEADSASMRDLRTARDEAFDEVGITLQRQDREQMHQIVFLLKKSIYETLRQAAFDNRATMQSILRSGLMMWFIAHGYSIPAEDLQLPLEEIRNRSARKSKKLST